METSPASDFEITALISPEHYSLQIIVYSIYMHLPVQTIKRPAAHTEVSGYECQRIHDHSTIYLMGLQHNNIIQFKPPRMLLPLLRLNCIIASIGLVIQHNLGQLTVGKTGKAIRSEINAPCRALQMSVVHKA